MPNLSGFIRRRCRAAQTAGINSAARADRPLSPVPPSPFPLPPSALPLRSAFTLTELLIVIAIIAVLAGLAATAAVNAMKAARRASISLELKQLGGAMDNFKNDYGAYPPNAMNPNNNTSNGTMARMIQSDFEGMFKKAFPKHQENPNLIRAICGQSQDASNYPNLEYGMTAAEALYFWLGGFSDDELYPISGPRGPSSLVSTGEIIEDRNRKYEFDLSRLRPVDDDGVLDSTQVRLITYPDPKSGDPRQIQFWRYHPSGSEQPIVYFDVSRHKPGAYSGPDAKPGRIDMWAAGPSSGAPPIFAIKQLRRGTTGVGAKFTNVVFVDQGKCQILHAGLDDEWGEDFAAMGVINSSGALKSANDLFLYYPTGPFLKETADTLGNFLDGTLADAQEASK